MTESLDLRGHDFLWENVAGEVVIVEEPIQVGKIARVPEDRPVFFAEFAGARWRIDHSVAMVGPVFNIFDPATGTTSGGSHYTSGAELRFLLDDRTYSLRRPTLSTTTWHNGTEDVVSFRRLPAGGHAFVLMGAAPDDAPALLLVGIVMAVGNTLFASDLR